MQGPRKPESTTLWRWLSRAVAEGILQQQGTGRCADPFRYWLPECAHLMHPGLGASKEEVSAWNQRVLRDQLPFLFDSEQKEQGDAPSEPPRLE